ncbi:MAG: hypothetical protein LLG03_11965 [Planctomycetaceae bacterium]|nr:hypothetical protein [Planctomycetaceae bacterium]
MVIAISIASCDRTTKEVSDSEAEEIIGKLMPKTEWGLIAAGNRWPRSARACGNPGKDVELEKDYNPARVEVYIEDIDGIRLRHKIMIGTDHANWKLIRKESTWPNDNPFKRIYVLRQVDDGPLEGLIFLKQAIVEIDFSGPLDAKKIEDFTALTWRTAARLEACYDTAIKPIAEKMAKANPVVTRPELPDPDSAGGPGTIQGSHGNP